MAITLPDNLSSTDRLELMQALLDSVLAEDELQPFSPEQLAELDRRVAALEAGTLECETWDVARERIFASLR